MESHHRRTSINPTSIESILSSGASTSPPAAPPSPHVGNSPNRMHFAMAPPPRPAAGHARTLSYTSRTRPNRLSLSFPVTPCTNGSESTRATPTSSTGPSFPPTPVEIIPSPNDPNGFLVAIAGQERRVLELKEELHKAEKDLVRLKKQWAAHEAQKKRAEMKHSEPMRSVQTVATTGNSTDESTIATRESAELDRRKMLLSNINIPPPRDRRVFSGSHTRALSLLSPDRSNCARPFPPVRESSTENSSDSVPRTSTMPDTSFGLTRVSTLRARPLSYHGGTVTQSANRLAEDFKSHLWTFMDDIRQATIGDDAANNASTSLSAKAPGKKISRGNLRTDKGRKVPSPSSASPRTWDSLTGNSIMDAADDWSDSDTPKPTKTTNGAKLKRPISFAAPDLDDDWSSWDSPTPKSPRWSSSTAPSEDPATPSHGNMDDCSVKIAESTDEVTTPSKREELQWPALDKLTPSNLRRTLSTVMNDWEKSLTPPPEDQRTSHHKSSSSTSEDSTHEALMLSR